MNVVKKKLELAIKQGCPSLMSSFIASLRSLLWLFKCYRSLSRSYCRSHCSFVNLITTSDIFSELDFIHDFSIGIFLFDIWIIFFELSLALIICVKLLYFAAIWSSKIYLCFLVTFVMSQCAMIYIAPIRFLFWRSYVFLSFIYPLCVSSICNSMFDTLLLCLVFLDYLRIKRLFVFDVLVC